MAEFAEKGPGSAAADGLGLRPEGDGGFIDFDEAAGRRALRIDQSAAKLGGEEPCGIVRAEAELRLKRGVEVPFECVAIKNPSRIRWCAAASSRAWRFRRHRLAMTAYAFERRILVLERPRLGAASAGTDEALRPALREQKGRVRGLIGKELLKLDERARAYGHGGPAVIVLVLLYRRPPAVHNIFAPPEPRG